MTFNFEKIINFIIGIILINNLYLLTGIIGVSSNSVIILCFILSFIFFIKNFNVNQLINQTNNWNTAFYLIASIPLLLVDWIINKSTPNFNDLIRVFIYSFYFSWTFNLYSNSKYLKTWFIAICLTSFAILTLQGIFEEKNPILFSILLSSGNLEKRALTRIAGTLIDANAYSGLLCIFLTIVYIEWVKNYLNNLKKTVLFFLIIFTVYLTELSGSRQTIIMLVFFFLYLFFKEINKRKIIMFFSFTILLILSVFIFWNKIEDYVVQNPSSSIARYLSGNNSSQSSRSDLERTKSLTSGFELIVDNNFIYGPGIINFASRYKNFTENPVPHNGFLYLFTQFGILFLIPLYFFYKIGVRSLKSENFILFILFFIHYSLEPNLMYYCTTYFVCFYIDAKYFEIDKQLEQN